MALWEADTETFHSVQCSFVGISVIHNNSSMASSASEHVPADLKSVQNLISAMANNYQARSFNICEGLHRMWIVWFCQQESENIRVSIRTGVHDERINRMW